MSGLALTYANTGDRAAADKGSYLVDELARCQARARVAGFHEGYLSAFPESSFDRLERPSVKVSVAQLQIHKIHGLGRVRPARLGRELPRRWRAGAAGLGDWVGWRTARLSYPHMQRILTTEHGGIAESLTNLYRLTWDESYLHTAARFYQASVFDPLARGRGQPARAARQHHDPENDRLPADVGGNRGRPVSRDRGEFLADRHRAPLLRHRRHQ